MGFYTRFYFILIVLLTTVYCNALIHTGVDGTTKWGSNQVCSEARVAIYGGDNAGICAANILGWDPHKADGLHPRYVQLLYGDSFVDGMEVLYGITYGIEFSFPPLSILGHIHLDGTPSIGHSYISQLGDLYIYVFMDNFYT